MNTYKLLFFLFFNIYILEAQRLATSETVAVFKGQQVTGVTVSSKGRIFANFPRWRKTVENSVVEFSNDGAFFPFPNKKWNQ